MRKIIRTRAAQQVADQLIPAEVALDQALASIAKLIATTVDARIEADLPMSCANTAIVGMNNVAAFILQARSEMVTVHAQLSIAQTQIGLREVSFGNMGGCPKASVDIEDNILHIAA